MILQYAESQRLTSIAGWRGQIFLIKQQMVFISWHKQNHKQNHSAMIWTTENIDFYFLILCRHVFVSGLQCGCQPIVRQRTNSRRAYAHSVQFKIVFL